MATPAQELIVVALAIGGPVLAGYLWRRAHRAIAITVFIATAAATSALVVRWGVTPGL